jgi:hypothetical protein
MDDFCPYIKQEMQKEISMLLLSRDVVIELIQNSLIAEPILFLGLHHAISLQSELPHCVFNIDGSQVSS